MRDNIMELLDEDGYPTTEALDTIKNWEATDDLNKLFEFIESIWWSADWGWGVEESDDVITYDISTGGWSGNESIINALQENFLCWDYIWVQSSKGGHHIFEIKKPKEKDATGLNITFTGKAFVVIESNWGPIEFSLNDLDDTTAVVRLVLTQAAGKLGVKSYTDEDMEVMNNMLRRIDG